MRMTPMPPAPSRGDLPEVFIAKADASIAAQGRFVTEANALAAELEGRADQAAQDAAAAAAKAVIAQASQAAAASSAAVAAAAAGAPMWKPAQDYGPGEVAWSPVSQLIYRRQPAGAGAVDPSLDALSWAPVAASWGTALQINANAPLQAGRRYHLDSTAGPLLLQMPPNPRADDWLILVDKALCAGLNNITLSRNGSLMPGGAEDYIMDVSGESLMFVYDLQKGWVRG